MNLPARSFLQASQNRDGGWGYASGESSTVEASAAVTIALRSDAASFEIRSRGLGWLRSAQHRDGGWGLQANDSQSGWQTAWAVLALAQAGEEDGTLARGVDWLLSVKTIAPDRDAMQQAGQIFAIDIRLRGWPWLPDQAS